MKKATKTTRPGARSVRFEIVPINGRPGEYFSIWRNGKRARMGFSDGRKWVEILLK